MPKNPYNLTAATLKGRLPDITGDVLFVDSATGNVNADGSSLRPFSTIEAAFNKSGLSTGDAIVVMPNHAETVSGAAGITADVAGVRVIGMGEGGDLPTITFSATASTITVTAASITFEDIIIVPSIDAVVSAFVVSADDVTIGTKERPVQFRDASSTIELERAILTTADADNFKADIIYKGFTGGNANVNAIRLVGCDNATINIDYFGIASTAVVEFVTTACTNIHITGRFYVSGTTDLSKNVVDTATGSTWDVDAFDASTDEKFAGGDVEAVASVDVSAVIDALHGTTGIASYPAAADAANNISMAEVIRKNTDLAYSSPLCVEKTDGAILSGDDDLFTITGGPIHVLSITGIVTTVVETATLNAKLTLTTTQPSATVDISAGTVDITGAAQGASIEHINTTAVLTVVTAGFVKHANSFATNPTDFLVPIGTIKLNSSAAGTGVIAWYLRYVPLSRASRVVAAS